MTSRPPRRHDERGQLGGMEALPFGVLIFVAGTMLAVNAWAVVDMRGVADSSARNYLRAYTAAASADAAVAAGRQAALSTAESHGVSSVAMTIEDPGGQFGPCELITVTVSIRHPAIRVPFIGVVGDTTTSTTQRELTQPFGSPAPSDRPSQLHGTACDG